MDNNNNNISSSNNSLNSNEAFIVNENIENKYSIILPNKLSTFPYVILGIIKNKYFSKISNKIEYCKGVGILIGNDVVLTCAHNLFITNAKKIIKIEFLPLINGKIKLIEPIDCYKFVIPKKFMDLKNKNSKENILKYDYGILFLNSYLGNEIINLFELHDEKNFKIEKENRFFNFFIEQNNYLKKLFLKNFDQYNMSMISITKIKEDFNDDEFYKYRNSINKYKLDVSNYNNNCNNIENKKSINFLEKNNLCEISTSIYNRSTNVDTIHNNLTLINNNNTIINNSLSKNEIILNDENYYNLNQTFSHNHKNIFFDKIHNEVICENRGKIINFNNENSNNRSKSLNKKSIKNNKFELKYNITTYSGQSGSPIFVRFKNNKKKYLDSNKISNTKYIFVGIHSRSSTLLNTKINNNYSNNNDNYNNLSILNKIDKSFYNIGLLLNNKIYNDIIEICKETPSNSYNHKDIKYYDDYILLKFDFQFQNILIGIFPTNFYLKKIFNLLSDEYFLISEKYIYLIVNGYLFLYKNLKDNEKLKDYKIFKNNKVNIEILFDFRNLGREYMSLIKNKIIDTYENFSKLNIENKKLIILNNINKELNKFKNKNILIYSILYENIQKQLISIFLNNNN